MYYGRDTHDPPFYCETKVNLYLVTWRRFAIARKICQNKEPFTRLKALKYSFPTTFNTYPTKKEITDAGTLQIMKVAEVTKRRTDILLRSSRGERSCRWAGVSVRLFWDGCLQNQLRLSILRRPRTTHVLRITKRTTGPHRQIISRRTK